MNLSLLTHACLGASDALDGDVIAIHRDGYIAFDWQRWVRAFAFIFAAALAADVSQNSRAFAFFGFIGQTLGHHANIVIARLADGDDGFFFTFFAHFPFTNDGVGCHCAC